MNEITIEVNGIKYTGTPKELSFQLREHEQLSYAKIGKLLVDKNKPRGRSDTQVWKWLRNSGMNEAFPKPKKEVRRKRTYAKLPLRRLNLVRTLFGKHVPGLNFVDGFTEMFESVFPGKSQERLIDHYIHGMRRNEQLPSAQPFMSRQIKAKLLNNITLLKKLKAQFLSKDIIRRLDD